MEKLILLVPKRERPCTPRTTRCLDSLWDCMNNFSLFYSNFYKLKCIIKIRWKWLNASFVFWFVLSLLQMQNHVNPAMDFTQTPPGMLALDNMLYLAKVHQDTYIRVSVGLTHDLLTLLSFKGQTHLTCRLTCGRLSWRTAAERISTSVPLVAVPLNSLVCCVRYSRLESCVSSTVVSFFFLFIFYLSSQ